MKKYLSILVFLGFLPFVMLAQDNNSSKNKEKAPTAVYVHLYKVASNEYGFKVWYINSANKLKVAYLPAKWFLRAGAGYAHNTGDAKHEDLKDDPSIVKASKAYSNRKGIIKWESGTLTAPAMTVYYSKGEFSHVVLDLNPNLNDESWVLIDTPNSWKGEKGSPYGEYKEPTEGLKAKFDDVTTLKLEL